MRISTKSKESDGLCASKYLSVCLKDIGKNNRKQRTSVKLGEKLDVRMFVNEFHFDSLDLIEKLRLFNWCRQFGDFLLTLRTNESKWDSLATTSDGFYNDVKYNRNQLYSVSINEFDFVDAVISHHKTSLEIYPYVVYDSDARPFRHIESFHQRNHLDFPLI